MYHADLETTVFGKPSHLEIPPTTNVPDMLERSKPSLGLVNRMRFKLLDGSLKGIELRNFNLEMSRLGKGGCWWEAFEVFKAIKQQGLQPDVFTYTIMIGAFGRGKQPERALENFEEMRKRGLEPNVITYNILISACEKGK